MITNSYRFGFLKKFILCLLILGSAALLGQQVLAQTVGACEFYPDEGWFTFLGGDAGDDNNWEPCEPDSDTGTSPQAEQPAPQVEAPAPPPPAPAPELVQPAPVQCVCDQSVAALYCTFQTFTDSCGNVGACSGIKACVGDTTPPPAPPPSVPEPEQPAVPVQPALTQIQTNCGPNTTQSIGENGAIVCVSQQQSQGSQTVTQNPTITVNPTISGGTSSNTITVQNPAPAVTVLARGSLGVGTTVVSGEVSSKVLGVKELPKTGLPALAWGALALIPLGAKLKNLFKFKGDLESHPVYFFEEREFKKIS